MRDSRGAGWGRVRAKRVLRAISIACLVLVCASTAQAQTSVRVTHEGSTIYASNFQTALTAVPAGTVLTVVRRSGDWYEVTVPNADAASGAKTGFIYKSNVELVQFGASAPAPSRAQSEAGEGKAVGFMGFGQFAYTRFSANQAFAAILGQSGGMLYGGGGEVRLRKGLFVNGSVEYYSETGQRAYIYQGQVFRLGTPDTITMIPVAMTAGWRFAHSRATPYGGAGFGRVFYEEKSSFADPSEDINSKFTSYHVVGGVEFRNGWVGTAFEVQYSHVPNAVGQGGASAAFNESNLGGVTGRVKILLGR